MASTTTIHATIDADVKEQATALLAESGMTVEDAVRLLLTQVVAMRGLPLAVQPSDPGMPGAPPWHEIGEGRRFASYDDWFRAEIEEALREADDPNTVWVPHEEVSRRFAKFRAECEGRIARDRDR
ncbi:MAG TPA: type II toxin-antitoxin system RelB/DinJ family antitoxin [Acidobacteriaceae bacterium]|nr:type II toxin-antitoxin system RelB/DinJ family antitoxin [Acidobacteriaceae bacterium]